MAIEFQLPDDPEALDAMAKALEKKREQVKKAKEEGHHHGGEKDAGPVLARLLKLEKTVHTIHEDVKRIREILDTD